MHCWLNDSMILPVCILPVKYFLNSRWFCLIENELYISGLFSRYFSDGVIFPDRLLNNFDVSLRVRNILYYIEYLRIFQKTLPLLFERLVNPSASCIRERFHHVMLPFLTAYSPRNSGQIELLRFLALPEIRSQKRPF